MSVDEAAASGREHLAERVRPLLDQPDEARIEFINTPRWIPYPRADRILRLMQDLLVLPRSNRMPNLLVVGDTNNGKTELLRRFYRMNPCVVSADTDRNDMPVVYVQAPPVPDEGRFYNKILDAVLAPYRTGDRVDTKERLVLRMAQRLGIRMLMIDEIHHIVAGHLSRQHHFRNMLKHLGNEMQVSIVAAGTKDAFNALYTDPQLENRFPPALLPRWERGHEWDRLIVSFERRLPLRLPSRLAYTASEKLLTMTEGAIGELSRLLTTAAVAAVRSGHERIDSKLLDGLGWIEPSRRRKGGADLAADR